MPKLSKIRLTGCRYAGLQKEHEDSIFDLTKNNEGDHSLFTLDNGMGKGVMMQLIFQILLPETRWGANNGNKVISMFYDQGNNLHQFTFHVVLEWILDTVPEKRLITGIAVKSIIKNTSSDDEEKIGLSYFLYTNEHENNGYYTVENLPLYDKETKKAVDLEKLENFIDNNKRDFTKYSQSSVRRKDSNYFRYLESRGIYRSEWLNLKKINRLEGGSGNYFTGASDNKSIFDKVIIPAISENIKNYSYDDGDNLIEMFRSNLSITKDLPILIKREGDYRELLAEIKPLISNADVGSGFIDIRERLTDEGNNIHFILNDKYLFVKEEIEKWENEFEKTKRQVRELEYKKDNLFYNQHKKDVESRENIAKDLDEKQKEKSIEIETKREEKILYKINKALYYRKDIENEIENKSIEKEKLIEVLDISDTRVRAEYLNDQIEIEWHKSKDIWTDIEDQYLAYINYTNQIKEVNKDKRKKYIDRVESLKTKVIKFELKEENLLTRKRKLGEIYDPLSLSFPERISEELTEMQETIKAKNNLLSSEIKNYDEKTYELDIDILQLKNSLESKKQNIELLNGKVVEQEKHELKLSNEISRQLMESRVGSLLSHDWFNKKHDKLESLKSEKDTKLDSIQRTIWEKNIDKILNKEDYFIPNKDIVLIKEEIKRIGINVQTGSEYLNEIDEEDKLKLINVNPGFLYSLVIESQKDWEIIDKNINKDIFTNNMVPIYIRSEMKSYSVDKFKTVQSKAYDLINKDEYMVWKSEMEKDIESLMQTENNIKEDLYNIDNIIQEIKIINTKDTSLILYQKIKEAKDTILDLLEKTRLIEEEKLGINNKMNTDKNILRKNEDKLEEIDNSLRKINEYIEETQVIEVERGKILSIKKEVEELKVDISNLDEDSDNILNNQDLTRDSYYGWKAEIGIIIKDVKALYKNFIYDYKVNSDYTNHKTPDFIIAADRLKTLVGEREVIEKDIYTRNTKIAVLEVEIENLGKDRDRYIKQLDEISKNWTKYEYLGLAIDELNIRINELRKDMKKIDTERIRIKSELDGIDGNLEIMKQQLSNKELEILKTHERAPVVLDIEDIDSELNIVSRDIESNERYFRLCKEVLDRNEKKKIKFKFNLSEIKNGYPLETTKGKTDKILKDKLEENSDLIVEEWLRNCKNNKVKIEETIEDGEKLRARFIKEVSNKLEEDRLRESIIAAVKESNIFNFKSNTDTFSGMKKHFEMEILKSSDDKDKAEQAMKQWTNRASMHVIKMIDALKDMVSSMNYTNEQGYAFPLVKLKGIERLPKEEAEIGHLLDEYFIESISKVLEMDVDISSIEDRELKDLMGDKAIFAKALQGRYPKLLVYKMSEKNEFKYARARDEYYTTWEAINKGEGNLPEGSGGQTLSVNTFVIMMIMSFKKRHIGNENPSTVLILDNLFGNASGKHVLDPIFEIANELNFQLICFAAPGIIKVEISERFPVFWELKIEDGKVVHGGRVIK